MGQENNQLTDLLVKVARNEENTKQAHKRIDELQGAVITFTSLASDVKVLTEQFINMKDDIKDVKDEVRCFNQKPSKIIDGVVQTIANGIFMIIISAIMVSILK